jgi:serine/threonine-protein kinase
MRDRGPVDKDELAKTLAKVVSDHAAHHDSFVHSPQQSIRPSPRAAQQLRPPPPSGLEMGKTIGQGGMGVVRLAKQRVLDRDVAVKTIQPKLASDAATRMLLQEALVLGRLEHPSIVPIYDIQYEGDEPRILLKKVEGVEWNELMRQGERIKQRFGEDDALSWNLRVLMQVCNAIHFAHSRGIIHRDLKPENIMIGEFGEVYVMDWGLGLALEDDGTGRFALASEATELAGTPQYLAPEMLGGAQVRISVRTDVYLLGSVLYEIITGRPPHAGATLAAVLAQVLSSRPALPDTCPAELATICRTAMDPDPGWRYESAEELRLALSRFLQHAGSYRLQVRATERCAALLLCLADGAVEHDRERLDEIQNLFGECRFAYRQALEAWPDNELARSGLTRATHAMIEHELRQHNAAGAANLLSRLDAPDAGLRERVEVALRQAEKSGKRLADLERYRKQLDVRTGSRNRAIGAGIMGIGWTVSPVLGQRLFGLAEEQGHRTAGLAFNGSVIVGLWFWSWFRRDDMRESGVTRRLMAAAALTMFIQMCFDIVGEHLGLGLAHTQVLWPLLWFSVSAMLVITVDARLWPMTLGFLVALGMGAIEPTWRFYGMAVCNLIMTINMLWIWMPRPVPKSQTPAPAGLQEGSN